MASSFFSNSDNDTDVILHTCDSINFFVHKLVLRLASPVFGDMFRIPQPSDPDAQVRDPGSDLPLVEVSESSEVFETLLRFCYPGIANPKLESRTPSEIGQLLEAAIKYEIDYFVSELKSILTAMTQQHPVAVYAVACRLNLESEARIAAEETLASTELEYDSDSELDKVSAGILYRLLEYRLLKNSGANVDASYTFCCPTSSSSQSPADSDSLQANLPWPPTDLPDASTSPDIFLQSSDLVIHPAHTLILRMTSTILDQPQLGQENSSPLTVPMPENSQILRILLHLCYPCDDPMVDDLDIASRLQDAAKKYNVPRAVRFSKKIWTSHLDNTPLRVFLAAKIFGWDELASEAARRTVLSYSLLDPYYPEMEYVPASAYRRLLDFRQKCYVILNRELEMFNGTTPHWRKAGDLRSRDQHSPSSMFPGVLKIPQSVSRDGVARHMLLAFLPRLIAVRSSAKMTGRGLANDWRPDAVVQYGLELSGDLREWLFSKFSAVKY